MAILRWRPISQGVERWEPFHGLSDVQSEVDRLIDSFFGRPGSEGGLGSIWAPTVDMYETKDELVVKAELPGVNEKDVHVSIIGDMLTIKGERARRDEVQQENHYRGERWYGRFERNLPLPIPVQSDKVKATYRDGVLTITLRKTEEIKPKEIKIDVV